MFGGNKPMVEQKQEADAEIMMSDEKSPTNNTQRLLQQQELDDGGIGGDDGLQQQPNRGATSANKPSDENQRHSNKVESIEVLISNPLEAAELAAQQHELQQPVIPVNKMKADKDNNIVVDSLDHQAVERMVQGDEVVSPSGAVSGVQYVPSLAEVGGIPTAPMQQLQSDSAAHHYGGMIGPRIQELDDYKHFVQGASSYGQGHHTQHHHQQMHHEMNIDEEVFADGAFMPEDALTIQLFKDGAESGGDERVLAADSGQNDKRFYTLIELADMEPIFERQFDGRDQMVHNAHVLLSPQEYRAKLYWLDTENRWKDIGTGRFRLLLSKDQEEHYIQVVSEDCIEDQLALGDDIEKAMEGMAPNQTDNSQSPQGQNGSSQGSHHLNNPSKQVFLHRCFVQCLQDFSRQGDTIITWQDDYKNEFALSFQDEKGAQNTWWSICFLKGIQINSNIDEQNEAGGSSETNSITGCGLVLPTKENLADQANDLFSTDAYARRNLAEAVLKQVINQDQNTQRGNNNCASSELSERDHMKLQTWRSIYLDKLQKIFNEVEQSYHKATKAMEENEGDEHDRCIHQTQQVNHLHSLFQIFRNLLNLNQSELLEVLLNENYLMTTFGALEYDPEVFSPLGYKYDQQANGGARSPVGQKPLGTSSLASSPNSNARSYGNYDHFDQANQYNTSLAQEADFREFLSNKVKYKQAVEISDPIVIYSIHLSYKLQYLKDTAMARFIDESTSHTIMQLVSSLHQIILDYIFGDDFERIQQELIAKMRDNSNVQDKENALKFFLEICQLLKSINLTNRQLQTCNNAFTRIMLVLAQIFDIMIPDRHTLLQEMKGDKEGLVKIFEARSLKDLSKAQVKMEASQPAEDPTGNQIANKTEQDEEQTPDQSQPQVTQGGANTSGEESKEDKQQIADIINAPNVDEQIEGEDKNSPIRKRDLKKWQNQQILQPGNEQQQLVNSYEIKSASDVSSISVKQDCIINPGKETVEEYLKNPVHSEDPNMTQIDILKSNSIEIFYNLLILLNNVNHSTIRDFLCSDHQKKHNYVFLRHLAQHMMYTSQQGIKVSICEFFKDLTSKETSEMQKTFQIIILKQVVSQFVDFLSEQDNYDDDSERKRQNNGGKDDEDMKDEEQKSQDESRKTVDTKVQLAFNKQIDQSRILILQFLNKLIVDNVDSYQLRMFFMQEKVLLKVAENLNCKSIQTHVEVIKFFKAIIQTKDTMSVNFMIKKQIFDCILELFLNNKTKGNLLHSCILNLFEMLTPAEAQPAGNANMLVMGLDNGYGGGPKTEGGYVQANLLNKLYQKLHENGYVKRVFFNKKYEDGFRKFNRSLRQVLDLPLPQSENDSKQASDRDRSNSQQPYYADPMMLEIAKSQPYNLAGEPNPKQNSANQINAETLEMEKQHAAGDNVAYDEEYLKRRPLFRNNRNRLRFGTGFATSPDDELLAEAEFDKLEKLCFNTKAPMTSKLEVEGSGEIGDGFESDQQKASDLLMQVRMMAGEKPDVAMASIGDEMNEDDLVDDNNGNEFQDQKGTSFEQKMSNSNALGKDINFGGKEEHKVAQGVKNILRDEDFGESREQVVSPIQHQSQQMLNDGDDGQDDCPDDAELQMLFPTSTDNNKEELSDAKDQKSSAKQLLNVPQNRSSAQQVSSMRAARSMSPMSGHAELAAQVPEYLKRGKIIENIGALQNSPEIESQPVQQHRVRGLSQEDFPSLVKRQNSSNSNKLIASDGESNGSDKGRKSAFNDTISNPDLDEIFFNKTGTGPTGFNFQIGPPTHTQPPSTQVRRQHSPLDIPSIGNDESPKNNSNILPKPFQKINQKKTHKPKFDRGRRACSENPPARTELVKLTFNNQESGANGNESGSNVAAHDNEMHDQREEQELHRLLDEKLLDSQAVDQKPPAPKKRIPIKMNRGDSICEVFADKDTPQDQQPTLDIKIGQKRSRQDIDDSDINQQHVESPLLVRDSWVAKRPKLTVEEQLNPAVSKLAAQNVTDQQQPNNEQLEARQQQHSREDQAMTDQQQDERKPAEQFEDQDLLKTMLDASLKHEQDKQN